MKIVECKCWCTWIELSRMQDYNWVTFDLCTLQLEYDKFGPLVHFQIGLLGFNFFISFNPPWETQQSKDLKRMSDDANSSRYLYKWTKVKNPKYKSKGKTRKSKLIDNTMFD